MRSRPPDPDSWHLLACCAESCAEIGTESCTISCADSCKEGCEASRAESGATLSWTNRGDFPVPDICSGNIYSPPTLEASLSAAHPAECKARIRLNCMKLFYSFISSSQSNPKCRAACLHRPGCEIAHFSNLAVCPGFPACCTAVFRWPKSSSFNFASRALNLTQIKTGSTRGSLPLFL